MASAAYPQAEPSRIGQLVELVASAPPPSGRRTTLPGRGRMFVRSQRGPSDRPLVVLLHGWIASGGLNWFRVFDALRARYPVIAPDLRGHGRGIRSWRRFRLRDCADDVAALIRRRRRGRGVIAVGYSMGGPVAQLLWRRHPDVVDGLVLAATSGRPMRNAGIGLTMAGIMEGAALAGRAVQLRSLLARADFDLAAVDASVTRERPARLPDWARGEMARHSWRHVLEAGAELGRYDATGWLHEIDVPTSVVLTRADNAIPPAYQESLARRVRGSRVYELEAGHLAFARRTFGEATRRAIDDVARRARI